MNRLKDYVVSRKLAKKMNKLGWDKETIFYWVKFDEYDKGYEWKLCLKTEDSFITVYEDGSILTEIAERSEYYPASLFAEIWRELPKEVPYDNDNYLYLDKHEENINERKDSISCLGYQSMELRSTLIEEKCNKNPVEAAGELWCWHREYDQEED